MKALLWLLALPGCAQLFGLDNTTAGAPDAAPSGVHFAAQLELIGATVVDTPDDPSVTHDTVAFLVPGGTDDDYQTVPSTVAAPGSWTSDIPTGTPLVDATILGQRQIWAVPSRDVKITIPRFGHPNPVPPPDGSVLNLAIAVPAGLSGAEQLSFLSVGAWSFQTVPGPAMPPATSIDAQLAYAASTTIGGALAKITPTDVVLVMRRRSSDGGLTFPLDGVYQTNIDQTGTDTLTGTLADTTVDKMVSAQIATAAFATRFTAVRPGVSALAMSWACVASPGFQRGLATGPTLNDGAILATDTTIAGAYGNPFASLGWKELLYTSASETRTVTLPGTQTFNVAATMLSITEPGPGLMIDMPAGLPQTISLDDIPITSDNMAVMVAHSYAHITMVNDRTANTYLQAVLFEVLTPTDTTASLKIVVQAFATDPTKLVFPSDLLIAGHTYIIQAITRQGGSPNTAMGDFQTQAPPFYIASNYSGVFTVSKP